VNDRPRVKHVDMRNLCMILVGKPKWNKLLKTSQKKKLWRFFPTQAIASSLMRFLDHIQRRTKVGRTPLDKLSARRRDLYLTTHNNHKRQTSMRPAGFEHTILADKRPQTYALDRAATGTGKKYRWKEDLKMKTFVRF